MQHLAIDIHCPLYAILEHGEVGNRESNEIIIMRKKANQSECVRERINKHCPLFATREGDVE